MSDLLILKCIKNEDISSPEFSYLFSTVINEARNLFETQVISWQSGSPYPEIPVTDLVLVLRIENIYITAESLKRMSALIGSNVGLVIPQYLSTHKLAHTSKIYTQRDFEKLEMDIFNQFQKPLSLNHYHLPVSLFSREALMDLMEKTSFEQIMTENSLLDSIQPNTQITNAGIFHQFIDYYAELRDDILPFIPDNIDDVLEIGCGRGITGKFIQENRNCRVTGVEMNPEVIPDARKNLSDVINGDIQKVEVPGTYDVVLATELFEHLNYPEEFLVKMEKVLKPGGRIVLSTPNVGHYSIVDDLLHGKWDYVPIGLLCYTHFRFFTYKTLEDYIKRMGFTSFQIVRQTTELPSKFRKMVGVDIESLSTKGFYVIIEKT